MRCVHGMRIAYMYDIVGFFTQPFWMAADDDDMPSPIDGLNSAQRQYMLVEKARSEMENRSSRSNMARDMMEGIQNSVGSVLGVLGSLVKGIFTKGGMKGGGGGKGF